MVIEDILYNWKVLLQKVLQLFFYLLCRKTNKPLYFIKWQAYSKE